MNLQNDLGVMEHEIVRMQEEEKKWLAHYSKLQGESEKRRQA